jgi:hypothetical protein
MGMENNMRDGSMWTRLYRLGALAPLVSLVFYLVEFSLAFVGAGYPASIEEWFDLFAQSKLLGLLYLNALDVLSITLLGLMFLALYMALRADNGSAMLMSSFFAFSGIPVFLVPRLVTTLAILRLSERYAAAATTTQQAVILEIAGTFEGIIQPTLQTFGFLLISVAVLILSVVMLHSKVFSQATAWVGLAAGAVIVLDELAALFLPALANPLMYAAILVWLTWWVLIAIGLFRLSRE